MPLKCQVYIINEDMCTSQISFIQKVWTTPLFVKNISLTKIRPLEKLTWRFLYICRDTFL